MKFNSLLDARLFNALPSIKPTLENKLSELDTTIKDLKKSKTYIDELIDSLAILSKRLDGYIETEDWESGKNLLESSVLKLNLKKAKSILLAR